MYDYILTLRSFLGDTVNTGDAVNQLLKVYYNLPAFADTLHMIVEALVYRRTLSREELLASYGAKTPEVKTATWDYSIEYLKKIGKDPESRRRRQVSVLRDELEPLEQMIGLIGLKFVGQDILRAAFDEQWKSLRRRRQETEDVYDQDFFTFADECLHYFQQAYVPLLNGTPLPLLDRSKKRYEASFFSQRYFERELSLISDVMGDIHAFRTTNPNMEISREETRKIMNGRIKSMGQIEVIYTAWAPFSTILLSSCSGFTVCMHGGRIRLIRGNCPGRRGCRLKTAHH